MDSSLLLSKVSQSMTKGKCCFPYSIVFFGNLLVKTYLFHVCVLMIGFELGHQLTSLLQPKVKYSGWALSALLSLVAGPRAPAGEEAADLTGFPPPPSKDYCNA